MFEKKKCPNCGKGIKDDFNFCPYCGEGLGEEREESDSDSFGIFENIDKEFEMIDKMFGSGLFKISSKPIRGGGINVTIHSTGGRPKVEVRTSGEYKRVEPQIKKRLGVHPVAVGGESDGYVEEERKLVKIPKLTEEPLSKVEKTGSRQIISVHLPGVREKDIDIRRLEQSLEVKAFAGSKAYFKLIPVSPNSNIRSRFKDGVLRIEIG